MSGAVQVSGTTVRRRAEPSFVVALLGLAVSAYLTVEHFTSPALLACPEGATINCAKVTSSVWSSLLGVPVALLGLLFFVAMAVLTSPAAWRRRELDPVRIVGAVAGVVMALYLVWVELFRVDALCLWCTGAHLCALALLGTVLWRAADRDVSAAEPDRPADDPGTGGSVRRHRG